MLSVPVGEGTDEAIIAEGKKVPVGVRVMYWQVQ